MSECSRCAEMASYAQDWKDAAEAANKRNKVNLKHTLIHWVMFLITGMALGDGFGPLVRDLVDRWSRPTKRGVVGAWLSAPTYYPGGSSCTIFGGTNITSLTITSWSGAGQVATVISGRMMLDIGPVWSSSGVAAEGSR